jgi:hypothetical protein
MEYMKTKERKGGLIEHGLGDWGRGIAFGNNWSSCIPYIEPQRGTPWGWRVWNHSIAAGYPEADTAP